MIRLPGIVDLAPFSVDPAAARYGIAAVAPMPGIGVAADVDVIAIAPATRDQAGQELAEIGLARNAGARAVATGGAPIADSRLMLMLLRYAAALDLPVIADCWDSALAGKATATDGETASRLGLASAPAEAEAIGIARDIALARIAGARLHIRQVTTRAGLELVAAAKAAGDRVSCGITPAHLWLSDIAIGDFNPAMRLMPPLRSEEDRTACLRAIGDGTIDILCSGARDRHPDSMTMPFADAAVGSAPQQSLLPLALNLLRDGHCDIDRLAALLSHNPARLLGIAVPTELTVDEGAPWRLPVCAASPFSGLPVAGRIAG